MGEDCHDPECPRLLCAELQSRAGEAEEVGEDSGDCSVGSTTVRHADVLVGQPPPLGRRQVGEDAGDVVVKERKHPGVLQEALIPLLAGTMLGPALSWW